MLKKGLVILMVLAMLVSVVGCGKDENDNAGSDNGGTAGSGNGTTGGSVSNDEIDLSEHVVIRYMVTGNRPTNGRNEEMFEKLNALLNEKVNASLEIYWIEWTDYLTNYNLTLASNDGSIDLVGTATSWLDGWPNAQRGAFLELTEDMLATYAPVTYSEVSDEHWNMCKYNEKIYLIPENQFSQWINHGFMYREDWASQVGLADGIHSWSDLETYFAGVKEMYPTMFPWDAAGSVGGANTLTGGWIASHTDNIFVEGLEVPIFFTSHDDLYTVESPYMTSDTFVDFAVTMQDWSNRGFWREDVLNYSGETREEFFNGNTAADQHHTETWYGQGYIEMTRRQPGAGVGFFYFGAETENLVKMSITHGATAVAAASKNPERALMVYDLLRNDEEIYHLFNYGIEGIQYELTEDGRMARPEGYDPEADGIQTNYWWGRKDDLLLVDANRDQESYEALTSVYETFAIDYPYGQFIINTEVIGPYLSNMSNVYATYMPLIAYGKTQDPAVTVEEFRTAMRAAGYDMVLEELQKQMDDFKSVYGQ